MAVKIRLSKVGRAHQVSYRIVAQDVRTKRDGKFLEILGFVNSHDKNNSIKINKDRIKFFVSRGATFTPSAKFVFEKGTLPPRPKKQREQKEARPVPTSAPAQQTQEPSENDTTKDNADVSEAQAQDDVKVAESEPEAQAETPQVIQDKVENQEKDNEDQTS